MTIANAKSTQAVKWGAVALAGALALSACAESQSAHQYVVGTWTNNGDPVLAPTKDVLFRDDVPVCGFDFDGSSVDPRTNVVYSPASILFEVLYDEFDITSVDVAAIEDADDRAIAETRADNLAVQTPLDTLFQATHPVLFDQARNIEKSEDLASFRDELAAHLPQEIKDADSTRLIDYYKTEARYMYSDQGEFDINRVSNVQGYIDDNNIDERFLGLEYDYSEAVSRETGDRYLMVRSKLTDAHYLENATEQIEITGASVFSIVNVFSDPGFGQDVYATLTFVNDGCLPVNGVATDRYWLSGYELLTPDPAATLETDTTDEVVAEEETTDEAVADEAATDAEA